MFVLGKPFHPYVLFASKVGLEYRWSHLGKAPVLAPPKIGYKNLPGTNTLAYWADFKFRKNNSFVCTAPIAYPKGEPLSSTQVGSSLTSKYWINLDKLNKHKCSSLLIRCLSQWRRNFLMLIPGQRQNKANCTYNQSESSTSFDLPLF